MGKIRATGAYGPEFHVSEVEHTGLNFMSPKVFGSAFPLNAKSVHAEFQIRPTPLKHAGGVPCCCVVVPNSPIRRPINYKYNKAK